MILSHISGLRIRGKVGNRFAWWAVYRQGASFCQETVWGRGKHYRARTVSYFNPCGNPLVVYHPPSCEACVAFANQVMREAKAVKTKRSMLEATRKWAWWAAYRTKCGPHCHPQCTACAEFTSANLPPISPWQLIRTSAG